MKNFISTKPITIKRFYTYYPLVVLGIIVIGVIETNVPFFKVGLEGAPFLLLVAIVALLGDVLSGLLAVILSGAALFYVVAPIGFLASSTKGIKLSEFLIAASAVSLLSWWVRRLQKNNLGLSATVHHLRSLTSGLEKELKTSKKDLHTLENINKQLDLIVDEFMQDDKYWEDRLAKHTTKSKYFKKTINKKLTN